MARLKRIGANLAVLSSSQLGVQAAIFVRNILVVRALAPVDYGVAATFGLALVLFQSLGNLSIGTLVIQAPDGEEPALQKTAQLAQAAQGALLGALLLLFAPLIAFLFQTQEATWCYRVLAFAAFAQGLVHLDPTRFKRRDRFAPQAWAELLGEVAALLLVIALLPVLQSYTIVLWSIVCQQVSRTIATHAFAERRYGWSLEREHLLRIMRFGWPMVMSSILLYVVMQGDRVLIGSAATLSAGVADWLGDVFDPGHVFGKADLARFSIAVGLTLMATTLIARVLGNLTFPVLARNHADPERFRRVYTACALLNAIAGGAVAVFFIVAGANVTAWIYTETYRAVGSFIGWLAVIQALRLLRGSLQGASLAHADSQLPLLTLAARATVLPLALVVTLAGGTLADLARVGVLGECLALAVGVWGLNRRSSLTLGAMLPPIAFAATVLAAALALRALVPELADPVAIALGVAEAASIPLLALATFPGLRRELVDLLRPPARGATAEPERR